MGRKKGSETMVLRHRLYTRVDDRKYKELSAILAKSERLDMSSLIRQILHNRPVKVFTQDRTLDNLMEELARLRGEIRAIGVNINQITHKFNTYPEPLRKQSYAKVAFDEHQALEPRINELLGIVAKLAKKWLSE